MKILALDISQRGTGVAIGRGDDAPRSFSRGFTGQGRAAIGADFRAWLRDLLISEAPDLVAIEAPILWSGKGRVDIMRLLTGLAFMAETVCHERGIKQVEIPINSWRKVFLGNGRPAEPKEECLRMCRLVGWETGGDNDRADALGVWATAHFTMGDRHAIIRSLSAGAVIAMA